MPGPHYKSQKLDKARAWYVPKPAGFFESSNRLDCKDFKITFPNQKAIMQISEAQPTFVKPDGLKTKYTKPESLSPSPAQTRNM